MAKASAAPKRAMRCAIYTRKSSEEGLEQEFNSLHAQREACEAFIASQRHEGWTALSQHYDDGGVSGATMERPALRQKPADRDAGVRSPGATDIGWSLSSVRRRSRSQSPGHRPLYPTWSDEAKISINTVT